MKNKLYPVLRWLNGKDSGELSLDLVSAHISREDAEQALKDDQLKQLEDLNQNDVEFTKCSCFGLEYQYDSDHDQYWAVAEIGPEVLDTLEFQWLCDFASAAFFDQPTDRNHLLSLWTAYCLHYNLDVDTKMYDTMASFLWAVVNANNSGPWKDFEAFDFFLCQYLV